MTDYTDLRHSIDALLVRLDAAPEHERADTLLWLGQRVVALAAANDLLAPLSIGLGDAVNRARGRRPGCALARLAQ